MAKEIVIKLEAGQSVQDAINQQFERILDEVSELMDDETTDDETIQDLQEENELLKNQLKRANETIYQIHRIAIGKATGAIVIVTEHWFKEYETFLDKEGNL